MAGRQQRELRDKELRGGHSGAAKTFYGTISSNVPTGFSQHTECMSVSQGSVKAGMVVPQRKFWFSVIDILAQAVIEQSFLLTVQSQGAVKFNPVTLILVARINKGRES